MVQFMGAAMSAIATIPTNPLLAMMSFFPFLSKIPYAYFLNGITPQKTASTVLLQRTNIANKIYDVQTMQKNSRDFAKKVLVIKLDSPKDFEKSTRL